MIRPTVLRKVGGATLQVPVFVDEETTDELVRLVNARLQKIEGESTRIDTQAFALLAAVSFAEDYLRLQEERRHDQEEILKTLRKVTEALRALARDFHVD